MGEEALLPLTVVYVTTTSAVLVCEVKDQLKPIIDFWNVYVDDVFHSTANNEGTDIEITHLYHRLLNLDRETQYEVAVQAVDTEGNESELSNSIKFTTFPRF